MPTSSRRRIGARTVAKFDVTAGMITDHLPALEYVLRDKAQRGEKIKAALLLIDVDSFGKPPATNVNIDSFLPPELSGEHPARFWWRYLTVFQLRMWRGIIAYRMRGADRAASEPSRMDGRRLALAGFGPARNDRAPGAQSCVRPTRSQGQGFLSPRGQISPRTSPWWRALPHCAATTASS